MHIYSIFTHFIILCNFWLGFTAKHLALYFHLSRLVCLLLLLTFSHLYLEFVISLLSHSHTVHSSPSPLPPIFLSSVYFKSHWCSNGVFCIKHLAYNFSQQEIASSKLSIENMFACSALLALQNRKQVVLPYKIWGFFIGNCHSAIQLLDRQVIPII